MLPISVSSVYDATPRRDSWDAIEKTKSFLSYGSLESLANLTNESLNRASSNNYRKYEVDDKITTQTHGILKNRSNYFKSVDMTDTAYERSYHNGSTYRSSSHKSNLVSGSALEMLSVNKPTSFSLDSTLDPRELQVMVTGKGFLELSCF